MSTLVHTTIYLVRHGETDYNRDGVYQGTLDAPLNPHGRWQALALAWRLSHVRFSAVYSSPLKRAKQTADTILRGKQMTCIYTRKQHTSNAIDVHSLPRVTVVPELRELSYGSWQGLTHTERYHADSDLETLWQTDPWQVRFPGGESLDDMQTRVLTAFDTILNRHRGDTILVSSHGHVNRILLVYLANLGRDSFWHIEQPNGCCSKITIRE